MLFTVTEVQPCAGDFWLSLDCRYDQSWEETCFLSPVDGQHASVSVDPSPSPSFSPQDNQHWWNPCLFHEFGFNFTNRLIKTVCNSLHRRFQRHYCKMTHTPLIYYHGSRDTKPYWLLHVTKRWTHWREKHFAAEKCSCIFVSTRVAGRPAFIVALQRMLCLHFEAALNLLHISIHAWCIVPRITFKSTVTLHRKYSKLWRRPRLYKEQVGRMTTTE